MTTRKRKAGGPSESDSEHKRRKLTPKWKTLIWKDGPLFHTTPKPLPERYRLKYKNRFVKISPKAEEAARCFAKYMVHTKYAKDETFRRNFFTSWRNDWMTKNDRDKIVNINDCDFSEIQRYMKENKNHTSAATTAKWKKTHGSCVVDGKLQSIGNFKIEPPGVFIGRGNHPHRGCMKRRILPKDITINCSRGGEPKGAKWKDVKIIHDPSSTWLAKYNNLPEFARGSEKYILLTADSLVRTKSDKNKYDVAHELGKYISTIERDYKRDLKSNDETERQRGVALYLIHKLSFRIGSEKGENEADTVGCCTLRREHISIRTEKNLVSFDYLGKDSIRYKDTVRVPTEVYNNLKKFKTKGPNKEKIFDLLTPLSLNDHLKSFMRGLSAKVFRTYNASLKLEEYLSSAKLVDKSDVEKLKHFKAGNRKVAMLCNHQKPSSNNMKIKLKNIHKKIKDKQSDVSKANTRLRRQKRGTAEFNKFQKQLEKCKTDLSKLKSREKEIIDDANYALSTSKANYIDPRIVAKWCKKNKIPINKIYSSQLQKKFRWAIEGKVSASFEYKYS